MKRLVFLFMLLSLMAIGVEAAQFVPMSVADMTQKAELIVRGRVLDKNVERDAEGRIFTRVRLELIETWKGKASPSPIEIVHSGGKYGGRVAVTSGQVDYTPGEEVVAFLVFNSQSQAVTLGLAQGKFHVWTDPDSGQPMARNLFLGNGKSKNDGLVPPGLVPVMSTNQGPMTSSDKLTVSTLKRVVLGGVK